MRSICATGIVYDGLTEKEAAMLDSVISGFFCPEGLEKLLAFEYESPDFVHMSVPAEMLKRTQFHKKSTILSKIFGGGSHALEPVLLPLFEKGRRLANGGTPIRDGLYFILSPEEVHAMRKEVEANLESKAPWKHEGMKEVAREYLLSPFENIEAKNKWLAARWC